MKLNFPKKTIIAFEVAGDEARAAIVERLGKRFQVVDFASIKREDGEEDLPSIETIRQLAQRLNITGGKVVFVTPLARAFDLLLDRQKISRLKHYQLLEAVRWEIEPYTGISGQNALLGVERERKPKPRPDEIVPEESEEQNVTVSAIERNVYRAAKARFKAGGFSLVRIYPPDVSFFMPLHLEGGDTPRAILEVGEDYSNFAVLHGGIPEQINTLSISLEAIHSHLNGESMVEGLEESLKFTIRQAPGTEALIISGKGAPDPAVIKYIAGFCPSGARPLRLPRAAAFTEAKEDSAVFGTVVGAGLREITGNQERIIGINDVEALVPRLKKSAYLMPLVATSVFVLLLGGHYLFMKHQDRTYKKRIAELKSEVKTRSSEVQKYDSLQKELKKIKDEIAFSKKKIRFFNQEADKDITHVIECLRGIGAAVPGNVVLSSIKQNASTKEFFINGCSYDQRAVGLFATALQKNSWCESAVIKKVTASSEGMEFQITVKTRSS